MSTEFRRLNVNDFDELLEMLNVTFGHKYGRITNFEAEQPRMWVRDEEHMHRHFGAFEDGKLVSVVGIYPLPGRVLGIPCLFATTGNVATLPEAEGKGYMNIIFSDVMREAEEIGVDACRLGGLRHRYNRFGFEGISSLYQFSLNAHNRIRYFKNYRSDIKFKKIRREDVDALVFCDKVAHMQKFYIERPTVDNYRDVYLSLITKSSVPYLALRDGEPIGYICTNAYGDHVSEIRGIDTLSLIEIAVSWQNRCCSEIVLPIAPHMAEEVKIFNEGCEGVSIVSPSRFRIINWQKMVDAFLKLRASYESLPEGEFTVEIEGYGTIRLYVRGNEVGCDKVNCSADIKLDRLSAARLLFGPLPPAATAEIPTNCKAWLPLPLTWYSLDYC